MSFMLLKVRSAVAVVTGSTIKMAANLARLGKEVATIVGGGGAGKFGGGGKLTCKRTIECVRKVSSPA